MSLHDLADEELTAAQAKKRLLLYTVERSALIARLERFKAFIERVDENNPVSVIQLKGRLIDIKNDFAIFERIEKSIEYLDSAEADSHFTVRQDYEESYWSLGAVASDIITRRSDTPASSAPVVSSVPDMRVKLPSLHLPKFAGKDKEDWSAFAAVFRSSVHQSQSFDDSQRLVYLRTCLADKALDKIKSLPITNANYKVAWDILVENYFDFNAILSEHVASFFNLPRCSKSSSTEVGELLDQASKHYKALEALEKPFLHAFPMHAVATKLDPESRAKWMERCLSIDSPEVSDLLDFLKNRKKVLLSSEQPTEKKTESTKLIPGSSSRGPYHRAPHSNQNPSTLCNAQAQPSATPTPTCSLCQGSHYTYACSKIQNLSPRDRFEVIRGARLCLNCFRSDHLVSNCPSKSRCRSCNKAHHTMLHFDTPPQTESASFNGVSAINQSHVILSTAIVNLIDSRGFPLACRALLDSGAQSNFITQKLADRLGLPQRSIDIPVVGVNQIRTNVTSVVNAQVRSRVNRFSTDLSFLVLPTITERVPSVELPRNLINTPRAHTLADPGFHKPSEVDLLVGSEIFYKLLSTGQVPLAPPSVVLQKTLFGWIVSGKIVSPVSPVKALCGFVADPLHNQLERFWKVEEVPSPRILSSEEESCERHFERFTARSVETGRYTVRLPFNDRKSQLGESYSIAHRRLVSLERSLIKNPERKPQYHDFLNEYEALGHMSELSSDDRSGFYLPHHAVFKQTSLTTKTRVVFDGSAKTTTGISLNDCLMVGPTIQDDLLSILLRFRLHAYVLTADLEKMYRQIEVHPADRAFQKILFRSSVNEPVKSYTLNTVTYGTASASFLATRALKQLALDEAARHPVASAVIIRDFYVDDLLTGARTEAEASVICDGLLSIMKAGGLNLRQWASNEPALITELQGAKTDSLLCLNLDETVKTLGIFWNAQRDSIAYSVSISTISSRVTKRVILSQIARLFDPLGLLGPIITTAKLVMQALWRLQLDWDESVPLDTHTHWSAFYSQLPKLQTLSINRCTVIPGYTKLQLHGFCDASERAYGACLYVRSVDIDGKTAVHLLCSKSRVAPLQSISIPRLELCSAKLLANLYDTAAQSLSRFDFEKTMLWSDSTITLHWLRKSPSTLMTFVANRVSEIQKLTSACEWNHIESESNAADVLSRGSTPLDFCNRASDWFHGPSWLALPESEWPIKTLEELEVPELRPPPKVKCLVVSTQPHFFSNFSSIVRLKRVVAYCLRFVNNCRSKKRAPLDLDDHLTTTELKLAFQRIIKVVQRSVFAAEIKAIEAGKQLVGNITVLSPFVDGDGILRVGGRLRHSDLSWERKHPMLLPYSHHVTTLVIRYEHLRLFHAPEQLTRSATRQYVWILNCRNAVKAVIRDCVTCFRVSPRTPDHTMGDLPRHRVSYTRPFLQTGVDFCGPFRIKEKRHRNRGSVKVYVAIFVCFATRAVHIEVVEDLTTEAFLASFRRFCARRGCPTDVHSDNGRNFTGAKSEIDRIHRFFNSEANRKKIRDATADRNLNWHFIPACSPHFGGLWEAGVKSFKHHLYRVAGTSLLSYEVFLTLSVEIESILNSRPLTPLSSDPNDLTALTPSHFLIGDSLTSMPEYDYRNLPAARLSSWEHAQQLKQHFWTRWQKEYLHELNVKSKWHTSKTPDVKVGQLVMMHDDDVPSMQWKLARVTAVHPGHDGKGRVVTVKTSTSEYKRAIRRISPLPIEDDN